MRLGTLLLLGVLVTLASCRPRPAYDLVIRHGTVYDGTGGAPVVGDVAVLGDSIVAVGDLGGARGRVEVDATGLAVAPGFINMLSWATRDAARRRPLAERHPAGRHARGLRRGLRRWGRSTTR